MQKFTFLRDQFPGNRHSRNSKLSFERKIVCRSDPVTLTHRLRIIRFHDHLSSGPRIPFSPFLRLHPPWLWSSACCIIKPIFALLARIRLCLHLRTLLLTHDLDDAITTYRITAVTTTSRDTYLSTSASHHDAAAHLVHLLLPITLRTLRCA